MIINGINIAYYVGVFILSILTFFAGVKKTSNEDIASRARFEGKIGSKLEQILKAIDKIENRLDHFDAEIEKAIKEHEGRYHHNA